MEPNAFDQMIQTIALTMGASFCAGINLYATVFVLGALARFTSFDLPEELAFLMSDWVLWPALALYTIEFVADKVPAVDTAWDTVHTFIRVPAAAMLAANGLGDVPGEMQILGGLLGGTLALGTHTTKAATRLVAHSTGTSPVVSPVVSVAEDVAVVSIMAFVVAYPVLSLFLLTMLTIGLIYIMFTLWKAVKFVFGRFFGRKTEEPQIIEPITA
ncbi:MAG: DUF4126 domain-containing protein [Candidatus Sumerlaeia bacterium]|nr:DUF4126 domain-containing protein [Candidatus Sumerlaeia bacterium]